ncbi:SMR family transporter [Virgibacillus sp. YIM 98842]|jgi:paired small multidrug resistance pump|uniref:DMT family transporter n=1 Tax=Virgibacillus sp. YIM 98842 TaxID=2663533 RepID=UPI0013D97485|nr:SMR family transporter [Virgibacillus sp. YIM 98842]
MNKYWNMIFLAAAFEVGWVVGLSHAYNVFTWILTGICIYVSFHFLIMASSRLPVGTAYAVFAGLGTAGTVIVEIFIFGEPFQLAKILLIALLVTGVFGLKTVTPAAEKKGGLG